MCSARNEPIERGAVVVIADRISVPTGKPRPAVVLQSGAFATSTLTICPITSIAPDAPLLRIPLVADATTGSGYRDRCSSIRSRRCDVLGSATTSAGSTRPRC
jgi:mRNA-degrading endonuclease toxin of MazEF toxin-antitoxin module